MRAAFYGLLRDDAIRTGGAAALLLRYTRYRGTGRGREGGTRRRKASACRPPRKRERALADRPEETTQSNAYLQIHHDNIRRGLHLRRRRART